MKNKIQFLAIFILFQSCYSYKTFELKDYDEVKPKKVKIELKNSQRIKGKVINNDNDKIKVKKISGTIEIPISQIKKIKQGESDWLKTFALAYGIFLTILTYGFVELVKSL